MKKSISLSFLLTTSIFLFSYSMEQNHKTVITTGATAEHGTKDFLLKTLYISSNIVGITYIAYNTALKIVNLAETARHADPESEAVATFFIASAVGGTISKIVYNFCFGSAEKQSSRIPVLNSNRFKKSKKETQGKKNWRKSVKEANRRHDKLYKRK